jgi:hypothetical protein
MNMMSKPQCPECTSLTLNVNPRGYFLHDLHNEVRKATKLSMFMYELFRKEAEVYFDMVQTQDCLRTCYHYQLYDHSISSLHTQDSLAVPCRFAFHIPRGSGPRAD